MAVTISKNDSRKIELKHQNVSGGEFDYMGPNLEEEIRRGHNQGVDGDSLQPIAENALLQSGRLLPLVR